MAQTYWTDSLSGIRYVFNLKQYFLAGYPAGYRISKKDGYPAVQPFLQRNCKKRFRNKDNNFSLKGRILPFFKEVPAKPFFLKDISHFSLKIYTYIYIYIYIHLI